MRSLNRQVGKNQGYLNHRVRCAARALIVKSGELLTVKMKRPEGQIFYILPGGGQIHGETLITSLQRECMEEIGFAPIVGKVAYVREYIGKHHGFRRAHRHFHQLEVVFYCKVPDISESRMGIHHDKHQIGVEWIALSDLASMEFYPSVLKNYIIDDRIKVKPMYLGDIN